MKRTAPPPSRALSAHEEVVLEHARFVIWKLDNEEHYFFRVDFCVMAGAFILPSV